MRKLFLLLGLWTACCTWSFAQGLTLEQFNQNRLTQQKRAMTVLGSWAVGNIALGLALQNSNEGQNKYFHQMNAGWNAVNLVIAGLGYWGVSRTDPAAFDLLSTINEQHRFQKILLFNAGLDIGYMVGGAYLIERAKNTAPEDNPDRLRGFGQSIVLQGAFLFVFDVTTAYVLSRTNADLGPLLSGLSIGPGMLGWRATF